MCACVENRGSIKIGLSIVCKQIRWPVWLPIVWHYWSSRQAIVHDVVALLMHLSLKFNSLLKLVHGGGFPTYWLSRMLETHPPQLLTVI